MKMERPGSRPLSSEEVAHLETLKSVVDKALDDGKFSAAEIDRIKSLLWADGKVTFEELREVHETIQSVMGNMPPGQEWFKYSR
ncbi:MAG: hypothetical protein QNJ46_30720 [Leptolyngbyaceae cyanobacterium MO_188.B28]|nr:hypothetical protein [Leptolyngbyaceae cyanobacterium MO_188.B28]